MTVIGYRRTLSRPSCDWCVKMAGEYAKDDIDCWRRHKNCDCKIVPILDTKDPGRELDLEDVAKQYGVKPEQVKASVKTAKEIKRDIKKLATAEADDIENILSSNSLELLTRPDRLKKTKGLLGNTRTTRNASGYDWVDQLTKEQRARAGHWMTSSDVYSPDLLAERVRNMLEVDWTDDEAMDWLTEQWLRRDGLRSVASGHNPKYVDIDSILPNDYEMEGYKLSELFGRTSNEAAGHVAQVLEEQGERYAREALGTSRLGPAPYNMDIYDYVQEIDELGAVISETLTPGVAERARERLQELAPPLIDDGRMDLFELWDEIRSTAIRADLVS